MKNNSLKMLTRSLLAVSGALTFALSSPFAAAQVPSDRDILLAGTESADVRPADANGYPSPDRLLGLEKELTLTDAQKKSLHTLAAETRTRAIELGKRIVQVEEELSEAYRTGLVSEQAVRDDADQIGRLRGRLRAAHLAAHLKAKRLLTADQAAAFRKLKNEPPAPKH